MQHIKTYTTNIYTYKTIIRKTVYHHYITFSPQIKLQQKFDNSAELIYLATIISIGIEICHRPATHIRIRNLLKSNGHIDSSVLQTDI